MDRDRIKAFLKSGRGRILLLCLAALLLLFLVWRVFFVQESVSAAYVPTEREARLCRLLEDVEGVKNATVMITEENGAPVSAIIVFEGADSILTRIRVLDITAAALGIEKKKVQVYPAEKQFRN